MGNFTDIEKQFNTRIEPIINRIVASLNAMINPQKMQADIEQVADFE